MQEILIVDLPTATNLLEAKRGTFWRYEEWKTEVEAQALERGRISTVRGAHRHLEEAARSDDRGLKQRAARQASNFMIQAAGGELAKAAMTRIWKSGILERFDCEFMFVVHDEVVLSVHKDQAAAVIQVVHEAVSQPYTDTFSVPFVGSISLGPNFGQQIELGEVFDAEKIVAAVGDLFAERN